jgi:phospho-N-acetylmuramoyl-pentapeptide-transferase
MLLWFLHYLSASVGASQLPALEKITLRGSLAALLSFLLAVALGPRMIAWLAARFREPIKGDSARLCQLQQAKQSTPTMGGLFLVAGLVAGVLVFGDLSNGFLRAALVVVLGFAALGAVDDLRKLFSTNNGLSARGKLLGQVVISLLAAMILYHELAHTSNGLRFYVPLAGISFPIGIGFIPWAVFVMVGTSNAVNLTDGLDGLAGGCLIFSTAAMALVAYASGHAEMAQYLNLPRIPGSGELAVLAGGMIGGVLGFLWFNCHPAQVFMGDTGSLPLGGVLGLVALATRQEMLLVVVGGVFVAEALSVMLQVGYYKWRGRRLFRCAPLHHHFQFQGWPETRIVVRFWIAAALCALLGLAALKLNIHDHIAPGLAPRSFQAAAETAEPSYDRY